MVFLKKTGQVLLSFVPFMITFLLQFILVIPLLGIALMYLNFHAKGTFSFQLTEIINQLSKIASGVTFNTAFFLVFSSSIILSFGFWYFKKFEIFQNSFKSSLRSSYWNIKIVIGLIILAVGLMYVSTYLINFVSLMHPSWMKDFEDIENTLGMDHMTIGLLLYTVILGPINEELIFRGLTLSYARKALPFWIANILQALLFGIYHMNMIQGCYAFVLGLFLGYVRMKGGSILFSMCLHIIYNFFASFANGILFFGNENSILLNCFWTILGVLLPLLGLYLYTKGANQRTPMPDNTPIPKAKVKPQQNHIQIPYI